jgi:peptidoglycan/LPS O-acetylase OafA/YrhL
VPPRTAGVAAAGAARLAHRPALDGLRALAVVAVLLHHARIPGVRAGFVGVDVFFTLSGFLITSLLLVEHRRTGRVALGAFWLRRARRLLPALFAVVLAVSLTSPFWMDPVPRSALVGDGLAAVFYVANWRAVAGGTDYFAAFGPPSALAHTWSLSVEEQFYVVWPLVVAAAAAVGARLRPLRRSAPALLVGVAVASALLTVRLAQADPMRAFYGTDSRAQELLLGAALGVLAVRHGWWDAPAAAAGRRTGRALDLLGAAGLVGLGLVVVLVVDPAGWAASGGFAVTAVLTAAVLAAVAGPATGRVAALLSWRPLVAVGVVSYGVYLWHWPVYLVLDPVRTRLDDGGADDVLLTGLRLGVTGLLAALSYRFVEQPVRSADWGRRDRALRSMALPGAVTACVAALVLTAVVAPVADERVLAAGPTAPPVPPVPTAAARSARPADQPGPPATPATGLPSSGPPAAGPRRVFVLGDSTAFNLHAQFRPSLPGVEVSGSTQLGCDLLGGELVAGGVRLGDVPGCGRWPATWRDQVAAARPDAAVLVLGNGLLFDRVLDGRTVRFGGPDYERRFLRWLDATVAALAASSGRVYVTDVPCFRKRDTGLDATADVVNDAGRQHLVNRLAREHLAGRPGVEVLGLRAAVCPGDRYVQRLDGTTLRTDGVHWSRAGARIVWDWLLARTA